MNDDYDRGFADGLKWVASTLRHSAGLVEQPTYDTFKRGNGDPVRAISCVGQIHFANQLRQVAQTIEDAITQSQDSK